MRHLIISLCTVAILLIGSLPVSSTSASLTSEAASHIDVNHPQAQGGNEFRSFLPFLVKNYNTVVETANPNASADAKRLLNYLAHLPDRQENRVISGQNVIATALGNTPNGYRNYVMEFQ